MINKIYFLIFTFFLSLTLKADYIDVIYEGESSKRTKSNARREIIKKSIEDTSRNYIKQIIGDVKYNRNLELINNRIIKNSGMYVPFIKGSGLEYDKVKKMNLMSVTMKLSLENLKRLLLKNGLLYKSDKTPKILPLIKIVDHVRFNKNSWWSKTSEKNSYNDDLIRIVHKNLEDTFSGKNFYTLLPMQCKSYVRVPTFLKSGNLRVEDTLLLGELFNAEIIIDGEVSIQKNSLLQDNYKVIYKYIAKQVNNGRIIAEVKRIYKTESGELKSVVFENIIKTSKKVVTDLSEQVEDSWQKGVFGSNSIILVIKGKLNYFQVKKIKQKLGMLNSIRLIRDRFYSSGLVKFEADVNVGIRKFSNILKTTKFINFKVKVDDIGSNQVTLKVKAI